MLTVSRVELFRQEWCQIHELCKNDVSPHAPLDCVDNVDAISQIVHTIDDVIHMHLCKNF